VNTAVGIWDSTSLRIEIIDQALTVSKGNDNVLLVF